MLIRNSEHIYYGPASFPVGGEAFHLSSGKSFPLRPNPGVEVEADDGSTWEYRGVSAYEVDNRFRIKGWQLVKEGSCYNIDYFGKMK